MGITLWEPIGNALESLQHHPFRVSVDSGHGVGKTFAAAAAVNWWYETRNPGVVITTAPTQRDVIDLLWTEVRLQRQRAGLSMDFIGPAAPEMKTGPEHYAKGYTARKGESFQGRHRPNMLFIFDEKEGIDANYWTAAKSMFRPGSGDAWLVIGNPTTTTSMAYQEHRAVDGQGNPTWNRVRLSCLDHPNMFHEPGQPGFVDGAVTPEQVGQWIQDWCDPVAPGDEQATDIEWKGKVYRPGPIGEPRILGLRPSAGTFGVWSESVWAQVLKPFDESLFPAMIGQGLLPIIGCDCANYGTDYTTFHVRIGNVSLYHYAVNGWAPIRINAKLMELAHEWAAWANSFRDRAAVPINAGQVEIRIDDDAEGRTLASYLQTQHYRVVPVNASSTSRRPDLYPNARCEMWFMTKNKAANGLVNMSRLERGTIQRIEMQAMAPEWWPDAAGRRIVESKDDLRKPERLGRSPDDMDGCNLAYYEPSGVADARWVDADPPRPMDRTSKQTVSEDAGSVVNRMKKWYEAAPESTKLW